MFSRFPSIIVVALFAVAGGFGVSTSVAQQEDDDGQWSPFTEAKGEDQHRILPRILPGGYSLLDRITMLPSLYSDPDNRLIQEIRLLGRYHWEYGNVSSAQGNYDGAESRRARAGLMIDFLDQFRFRAQVKGTGEQDLFGDNSVEDMWVAWRSDTSDQFTLKLGQFKPLWSYEWGLSSNTMPIIERSQFVQQFAPDRSVGLSASLERGNWSYGLAGFSGNLDDGASADNGAFGVLNIGYDLSDSADGWDVLRWRFDYLYNNDSIQVSSAQSYRNALSMSLGGRDGRLHGAVNAMYVDAMNGEGNALGLSLIPGYEVIPDKLELVGRYHYSNSESGNSLLVQSRYESEVPEIGDGRGGNYHSAYIGLNWILHKHVRFMNGVEYSTMRDGGADGGDFDGWTFFSGLRLWF